MARRPPSVDALASSIDDGTLPRALLVEIARAAVEEWRSDPSRDPEANAAAGAERLAARKLRRVINATGVLLHTNLGRAPLHPRAAEAERSVGAGYATLEIDPVSGKRGRRGEYAASLARALTGAEAALVVNNNAGALILAVAALGAGRKVVVSRGEQIEIGGSFRLPDIVAAAGAIGVEVGTTNRTRLRDYKKALGSDTGLLLKVHPSNYRVEGFSSEVSYRDLAGLAKDAGVPLVADVGSGLLDERTPWLEGAPPPWLQGEPGARQVIEAGADLVLFSGDKLLGGPQAGIIVGRRHLVDVLSAHPIARTIRIGGPALAALEATLDIYARGGGAEIPFWQMATLPAETLEERSLRMTDEAGCGRVVAGESVAGAGSVPGSAIPGPVVAVDGEAEKLRQRLLAGDPPVIGRVESDVMMLDLRSVDPSDDSALASALRAACR